MATVPKAKLRCPDPNCRSTDIRTRTKSNTRYCRVCGKEWKKNEGV